MQSPTYLQCTPTVVKTDSIGVQFLLPKVESTQYMLPEQCILRPEADRQVGTSLPDLSPTTLGRTACFEVQWCVGSPPRSLPQMVLPSCAFRFWPAERGKQKQRRGQWRCGECGKLFHGEHYLDRHVQRTHLADLVPPVRT